MEQLLSKRMSRVNIFSIFWALVGVVCSGICFISEIRNGWELLFLPPLVCGLSVFVFGRAYTYWKDNIAFVIIFLSIAVRYFATPVLMVLSGSHLFNPTAESFRVASIVYCYEIIVLLFCIDYFWTKHKAKRHKVVCELKRERADFELSWAGWLFLMMLLALVVVRGHLGNVFSHLSTWWNRFENNDVLYTYDLVAVEVIKSALVLSLVSFFAKLYYKNNGFLKILFLVLALCVAVSNTMLYQYENRTSIIQLFLSTMYLFISFFPHKKKSIVPLFVIGGTVLVGIIFYEMNISTSSAKNSLTSISKSAELYVTGPSMVAKTRDTYYLVREDFGLRNIWADFVKGFHFFDMLPFLRPIYRTAVSIPRTNDLFVASLDGSTCICPNYTFATYYASSYFGWLLEAVFILLIIKLICFVDDKKSRINDACFNYGFVYFELLLAQAVFVNNFFLLWHAFTMMPAWLLIFAWVNRWGRKTKIICT